MGAVHVFIGPTLSHEDTLSLVPEAILHSPVKHGDLLRLNAISGDVVVIVDGRFHQAASVRHKEILFLISMGVRVIGCSSMGALRGAELEPLGMVGHGAVFDLYRRGVIDGDDEVAVAHGEAPDYRSHTVPLVAFRTALEAAVAASAVTERSAGTFISLLKAVPYTGRSWASLGRMIKDSEPELDGEFASLEAFLAEHPDYADVKAADARDTLTRLDELVAAADRKAKTWTSSQEWQSQSLDDWRLAFSGGQVDGIHVADGEVLRYQQIYHPDFPLRWREFVIGQARMSVPGPQTSSGGPEAALAAARYWGVEPGTLTRAQEERWLLPEELSVLTGRERLVTLLTRSYWHTSRYTRLAEAVADLLSVSEARCAVAEAAVVNRKIADSRGRTIRHIKREVLLRHLAELWRVNSPDDRHLAAAARDRGFGTLEEALNAARSFYLRDRLGIPNGKQARK